MKLSIKNAIIAIITGLITILASLGVVSADILSAEAVGAIAGVVVTILSFVSPAMFSDD